MTNAGTGYTSAPNVTIAGGGGSGATGDGAPESELSFASHGRHWLQRRFL